MEAHIIVWPEDVIQALEEIDSFPLESYGYRVFSEDLKGKRAIERNPEIIGKPSIGY